MSYSSVEEMINTVLPLNVRKSIYTTFNIALKAYQRFMQDNANFFDTELQSNITNRILGYAVERQFFKANENTSFPFLTEYRSVNKFRYKATFVCKDDVIMNVVKTKNSRSIPAPSKYRRENALNNRIFNRQIQMGIDDFGNIKLVEPPYYCIITYGIDINELSHLTLIVPDDQMKNSHHTIDLKNEAPLYGVEQDKEDQLEVEVATLKEDLVKKYIAKNE